MNRRIPIILFVMLLGFLLVGCSDTKGHSGDKGEYSGAPAEVPPQLDGVVSSIHDGNPSYAIIKHVSITHAKGQHKTLFKNQGKK